jgi:hypothetical protein
MIIKITPINVMIVARTLNIGSSSISANLNRIL